MLFEWLRRKLGISAALYRLDMIMSRTEELSSELTELGTAVDDLAGRIDALPESADQVTQEQLDQLRAVTGRVVSLAQAAPEVPTDPGTGEPTDPSEV